MTLEAGLLVSVLTSIAGLAYWLGKKLSAIETRLGLLPSAKEFYDLRGDVDRLQGHSPNGVTVAASER